MPIQSINSVLPCGKPASIRTLTGNVMVGSTIDEGDVDDSVDIAVSVRYVVSGTPADGTITYNGDAKNIGETFEGVSGQTSFSRSAATVRLIRVQGSAVDEASIEDAYYIVAGDSADNDTITYPVATTRYSPGDIFRGQSSFDFEKDRRTVTVADGTDIINGGNYVVSGTGTITYNGNSYDSGDTFVGVSGTTSFSRSAPTAILMRVFPNNVAVYKIADNGVIETLTRHKLGAVAIPNIPALDNSGSIGESGNNVGAAIPADNLEKIYVWNFGTSTARVWFRSFIPNIDNSLGATRRDVHADIPADQVAFCWLPTELFRQGANNSRFTPADTETDAASVAQREAVLNAFIIQTAAENIWIKPEASTFLGVQ